MQKPRDRGARAVVGAWLVGSEHRFPESSANDGISPVASVSTACRERGSAGGAGGSRTPDLLNAIDSRRLRTRRAAGTTPVTARTSRSRRGSEWGRRARGGSGSTKSLPTRGTAMTCSPPTTGLRRSSTVDGRATERPPKRRAAASSIPAISRSSRIADGSIARLRLRQGGARHAAQPSLLSHQPRTSRSPIAHKPRTSPARAWRKAGTELARAWQILWPNFAKLQSLPSEDRPEVGPKPAGDDPLRDTLDATRDPRHATQDAEKRVLEKEVARTTSKNPTSPRPI